MFRWDPQQYQQFAGPRARPFGDLVARIGAQSPRHVVDLGCGAGELTATLTQRWPAAHVVGLDSSAEMLTRAAFVAGPRLSFGQADVAVALPDPEADVVVSNALFQWVPDHLKVIGRWIDALAAGSWFAFQVPGNFGAASHVLMRELAASEPWSSLLPAHLLRHDDAVLTPGQYATVFLAGPDPVLEWVRGTGLRPLVVALPANRVASFEADYAARLREAYPTRDDGLTPFEFRRIFCVANAPSEAT